MAEAVMVSDWSCDQVSLFLRHLTAFGRADMMYLAKIVIYLDLQDQAVKFPEGVHGFLSEDAAAI